MIKPIASTQVRIFLRPDAHTPPIDVYMPILFNSKIGSYHVPVHTRQNSIDPYIDVQFGSAGYPGNIERLWRDCKDYFHSIWVRYYDDSLDHDRIFWITSKGKSQDRLCRYNFDHMRFSWKPDANIPDPSEIGLNVSVHENLWGMNVEGSYLAANNRSEYCSEEPKLRPGIGTKTTPGCLVPGGLKWDYYKLQPKGLASFAIKHRAQLQKVEFYHQRRLVRAEVIHPQDERWGWGVFSLDDWDNCADPYYLKYADVFFYNKGKRKTA